MAPGPRKGWAVAVPGIGSRPPVRRITGSSGGPRRRRATDFRRRGAPSPRAAVANGTWRDPACAVVKKPQVSGIAARRVLHGVKFAPDGAAYGLLSNHKGVDRRLSVSTSSTAVQHMFFALYMHFLGSTITGFPVLSRR